MAVACDDVEAGGHERDHLGRRLPQLVAVDPARGLQRFVSEAADGGRRDRLQLAGLLRDVFDGLHVDGFDGHLPGEVVSDHGAEGVGGDAVPRHRAVVVLLAEEGPASGATEEARLEVGGEVGGPGVGGLDLGDPVQDDRGRWGGKGLHSGRPGGGRVRKLGAKASGGGAPGVRWMGAHP